MIDISTIPFWVWWLLGFAAGYGLEMFICSKRKEGVIHITSGEIGEPDKYLFEFNILPEDIPAYKQVVFEVQFEKPQNLHGT